jgi:cytochrome c oxidase assembly protein subunit 15
VVSERPGGQTRIHDFEDPGGSMPGADVAAMDPGRSPGSVPAYDDRSRPTQLSWWLFVVAGLVFAMVVVGGATRLTQSGLSMTSWEPVSGTVPPLSEADWKAEFDGYRATPEYRIVNSDMTLSQFKGIFWWEYVHRLLGRIIGLALLLPFVWFLARRAIPAGYGGRIAVLIALVGLQGAIGWWMVASGLVERPDVAHERLALHLITALILLGALVWTALDLRALGEGRTKVDGRPKRWILPFMALLSVQFVLGAFVAGLDAGRMHTTWPSMTEQWTPDGMGELSPIWSNAVDNPVTVQFLHRWMGVVVAVAALAIAALLFRAGARRLAIAFEAVVLAQFVLGVLTLLHAVPVALGVAHQAVGTLLLVVTVVAAHWSDGGARRSRSTAPEIAVQE